MTPIKKEKDRLTKGRSWPSAWLHRLSAALPGSSEAGLALLSLQQRVKSRTPTCWLDTGCPQKVGHKLRGTNSPSQGFSREGCLRESQEPALPAAGGLKVSILKGGTGGYTTVQCFQRAPPNKDEHLLDILSGNEHLLFCVDSCCSFPSCQREHIRYLLSWLAVVWPPGGTAVGPCSFLALPTIVWIQLMSPSSLDFPRYKSRLQKPPCLPLLTMVTYRWDVWYTWKASGSATDRLEPLQSIHMVLIDLLSLFCSSPLRVWWSSVQGNSIHEGSFTGSVFIPEEATRYHLKGSGQNMHGCVSG